MQVGPPLRCTRTNAEVNQEAANNYGAAWNDQQQYKRAAYLDIGQSLDACVNLSDALSECLLRRSLNVIFKK